jgi:hypothetical protein
VIEAFGSDSAGNVVAFIASNTDANLNPLPDGGLYVTYAGLAGACTGVSGTDVPFKKVVVRRWPRPPIAPRHAPVWRFHNSPAHRLMRQPGRPVIRPNIRPEIGPGKLPDMRPELRP